MGEVVCCAMRRKVIFQGVLNVPAEACGIPDSATADFMVWDSDSKRPTVTFRFCPWCGKPWERLGEIQNRPEEEADSGDYVA